MSKKKVLTHSKKQKVQTLIHANRLQEARSLCERICITDRADPEAWVLLSTIDRRLGRYPEAEAEAKRALSMRPQWVAAHRALGMALQAQGKQAEAIPHYRSMIALDGKDAEGYYLLGNALREQGLIQEAAQQYRKAVELRPDYLEALSNLGAALTVLGQTQEAAKHLSRARQLRPEAPQVLCNIATLCQMEKRYDDAREYGRLVLRHAPGFVDALALLADLEEKANRPEEARPLMERGLTLAPDNITLNLVFARLAQRDDRVREAIDRLERLCARERPERLGDVRLLLGKLYDKAGDTDRAFASLAEGNRLKMREHIASESDQDTYLRRIGELRKRFRHSRPETWTAVASDEDAPIFLVGFPRSGTTLLEQILDSHPRLQAMEEKPTVAAMEREFLNLAQGRPEETLANLTDQDVQRLRKAYFDMAARYIKRDPGQLLVDKQPLNLVQADLIWRVFPDARFILAIRHPCDVCLSCYMQNFWLNEATVTFFSLPATVEAYAGVMDLWREYTRVLPIKFHRIRYEDLVTNFETETRALLDFLGVGWDEAVRNHTEHARQRGNITTPSYNQVIQPIYQSARYRWKRYAKYFEPVLPRLQPYIEFFGYAEQSASGLETTQSRIQRTEQ